jgi:hypothetical protein
MITPISHLYLLTLLPLATTSPDEVALYVTNKQFKKKDLTYPGLSALVNRFNKNKCQSSFNNRSVARISKFLRL